MFCLNALHAIAALRGDGLRPEFLALIDRIEAERAVADIALHRGDAQIQAGPNPTGFVGAELPDGVVKFPQAACDPDTWPGAKPAKRTI
ncbi:hypothetical protein [Allomesorhizobium alhagi]|jgi:hypothetical protein|uniref:Uncharacterized protein n=1 Tax=Mesorhizobium alhagi CCNWXJ12-2 TaxID=1107882 RepID=H0HST1_9HYPH|nr:hypothetical protein [Mesorhizobium alhagi]EHK56218.1 hypothetical protein MAXJ12_16111 [Mesorhizobium alhagi CCNWXJ12-2]